MHRKTHPTGFRKPVGCVFRCILFHHQNEKNQHKVLKIIF